MGYSQLRIAALVFALVAACGGDDDGDGAGPDGSVPDSWSTLLAGAHSSLLAVWGSSAEDIWVVGGDDRGESEQGPLVLHYDGAAWTQLDPGVRSVDLWWVFGFAGGPVFFGGSNGTILRYEGGNFESFETPDNAVVFGIWGATADDLWAVGGRLGGGGGFVWRFDGETWTAVDIGAVAETGNMLKVAGRSADDVWMSGGDGVVMHWDGAELTRQDIPLDAPFFSIVPQGECTVAVGGSFTGALYEDCGGGWNEISPSPDLPVWRGVAATADTAIVVGEVGAVMRRDGDGAFQPVPTGTTTEDLHAAWIDSAGDVWAVGGRFDAQPTTDGVLIHFGGNIPEVTQ